MYFDDLAKREKYAPTSIDHDQKPTEIMQTVQTVKTVIADDHHLFITGLRSILQTAENFDFEIMEVAHTGEELLGKLKRMDPELLILDLNMPERDGLDVLTAIRSQNKALKILALTMYDDSKIVKSAFKSGVDGYVLKSAAKDELLEAIYDVMAGNTHLGNGVRLNEVMATMRGKTIKPKSSPFEDRFIKKYNLTKREIEILRLITQALSNKEIAKELFISDQTVSVHRKNIMRKLGVSNTAGLIKIAYDNSLI